MGCFGAEYFEVLCRCQSTLDRCHIFRKKSKKILDASSSIKVSLPIAKLETRDTRDLPISRRQKNQTSIDSTMIDRCHWRRLWHDNHREPADAPPYTHLVTLAPPIVAVLSTIAPRSWPTSRIHRGTSPQLKQSKHARLRRDCFVPSQLDHPGSPEGRSDGKWSL